MEQSLIFFSQTSCLLSCLEEIVIEPEDLTSENDIDSMITDDSSAGPLEVRPKRKYQKRKGM